MRIYKPLGSEHFEDCHPVKGDDFFTLDAALDGTPRGDTWRSPQMKIIRMDRRKKLKVSDSPWLGTSTTLIFRPRVVAAIGPLLREYGELLPLVCEEPDLVIYNVTRVIDGLDEQASTLSRFSDGRILRVSRYVFRPEIVAGVDIFKISNERPSPTFVSDRFVEAWTSAGLRGLDFPLVWSG